MSCQKHRFEVKSVDSDVKCFNFAMILNISGYTFSLAA